MTGLPLATAVWASANTRSCEHSGNGAGAVSGLPAELVDIRISCLKLTPLPTAARNRLADAKSNCLEAGNDPLNDLEQRLSRVAIICSRGGIRASGQQNLNGSRAPVSLGQDEGSGSGHFLPISTIQYTEPRVPRRAVFQ